MRQWHTFGVEWTPGKLVYTLDGSTWATVSDVNVPAVPMRLCIQSQAWPPGNSGGWQGVIGPATPPVGKLYVDWAVAYAPTSTPTYVARER